MYVTIPGLTSGIGSSRTKFAAFPAQYAEMHAAKTEIPRRVQTLQSKIAQIIASAEQVRTLERQAQDATAGPSDPFSFSFMDFAASSEVDSLIAELENLSRQAGQITNEVRAIGNTGSGDLNSDQARWGLAPGNTVEYIGKHHDDMYAAWELYEQVKNKFSAIDQNLSKYTSKITTLGRAASQQLAQVQADQRRQQDAMRAQEEAVRRQEEARLRQEQAAMQAEQRRVDAEIQAEQRRYQAELAREQAVINAQMQREQAQLQAEAARENARMQAEMQRQQQQLAVEQQKAAMEAQVAQQRAALEQQKLQAELAAQYPDVYGPQAQVAYQQPAMQMPGMTMYMPNTTQIMQTGYDGGGTYANLPADWMNQAVPPQVLPAPTSSLPANWMNLESQSVQAQSDWWNPGGSNEMFGMGDAGTTAAGDMIRNIFTPENVATAQDIAHTVAPKYVPARVDPEAERKREEEAARAQVLNTVLMLGAAGAAVWIGSRVLRGK